MGSQGAMCLDVPTRQGGIQPGRNGWDGDFAERSECDGMNGDVRSRQLLEHVQPVAHGPGRRDVPLLRAVRT